MISVVELRDILNEVIRDYGDDVSVCVPRDDDYASLGDVELNEFYDPISGENVMYFIKLTAMKEKLNED